MSNGKIAKLSGRGVVAVSGPDAAPFLDNLFTTDASKAGDGNAVYGGLLTPQGKILFDFIVFAGGNHYLIDISRARVADFVKRLGFYKLRAKVIAEDLSEVLGVLAVWEGMADTEYSLVYADPRLPELGLRVMLPPHLATDAAADLGAELADASAYEAHRIVLGVPRGGLDFIYGDAFPHETDMDQLAGIDFDKGCYVGQEVVSRMEHRGTARNRIVPVIAEEHAPDVGVPVMAGDNHVTMTPRRSSQRSVTVHPSVVGARS